MVFTCRAPSDNELTSLDIFWFGQRIAEKTAPIQQIRRSSVQMVDPIEEYRREILGHPTQAMMENTCKVTDSSTKLLLNLKFARLLDNNVQNDSRTTW